MMEEYWVGVKAYKEGKRKRSNPYHWGYENMEHYAWECGYDDAAFGRVK